MPDAQSRLARLQPAAAGPDPRRWLMLPVVLTAMFMASFDIWAVNVAAPSLQRDLHVSDAALQLIVGGYAFMYASGMVTGGRLGDLFGYRRLFMIGVISFAAALVVPHAWGQRRPRLDPLGALGVSTSIALALVPLTLGRDQGWPPWTWVSLAASLPVLALTLAWERRLTRRNGEPLLDLPLFRDRNFSAGLLVNFGLVFFFASFMFVLTLLLQAGLGQSPLHAGIEALPLAAAFTTMSILSPRFSARLGPRSITLGATITTLGTIGLALTGAHYGAHLTGWDLAPATVLIGLGQGIALPSLIGAVLAHVRPERAGAAAGILTTTQQFGAASGIAVIGAVFYGVLGTAPARGTFVSGMVVAMTVSAALVAAAAAATLLLPRRTAARHAAGQAPAAMPVAVPAREQVTAAAGPAPADAG